jgi:hypothetical protein
MQNFFFFFFFRIYQYWPDKFEYFWHYDCFMHSRAWCFVQNVQCGCVQRLCNFKTRNKWNYHSENSEFIGLHLWSRGNARGSGMKYVHMTYNFVTAKPKVVPVVLRAVCRLGIMCFERWIKILAAADLKMIARGKQFWHNDPWNRTRTDERESSSTMW